MTTAALADLALLEARLAARTGRPLVVHHFATWCGPCEEELPILARLLAAAGAAVQTMAVAWDLFLPYERPETVADPVRSFLERLGARFDEVLIFTGTPPELFASQRLEKGTVPFTDVRDASGRVVAVFEGPILEMDEQERFAAALRQAQAAEDAR